MIIQCINCNKKFEVSSTLIPHAGRNIQCGSCNHTWFYKSNTEITSKNLSNKNKEDNIAQINVFEKNDISSDKEEDHNKGEIIINDNSTKITESSDQVQIKKSSNFSIGKILSYFVVGIITFIALIIILDTFESPLSNQIPSLELLLYNLFETIKDIILFLKDLLA
jgi:predicted Zn finger-like uncharacterized protein